MVNINFTNGRLSGLRKFFLCLFLLLLSLVFAMGCTTEKRVATRPAEPSGPMALGEVLVMPFENMYKVYGQNVTFRCPLCGAVHITGKVEKGAEEYLTDQLFSLLQKRPGLQLIGPGQGEGAKSRFLTKKGKELTEVELLLKTAQAVGADSILVGRIFRFTPRVGNAYSVEMPASVAFNLYLLRASDGHILWNGKFDETQKALNENLFQLGTFFKRKAKWLTAEELALYGLKDVLETFPRPS